MKQDFNDLNDFRNYRDFFDEQKHPKKPRFIIETEWDLNFWALLPQINWNIHYCEIELRWLCGAIIFRDDKRFHYKQWIKPYEKQQKIKMDAAIKYYKDSKN